MKKTIAIAALAATAQSAFAFTFFTPFTGMFTEGDLTGYTIDAFIEIEDNGLFSGTADTNPMTLGDGDLFDLGFTINDEMGDFFTFFDLFDDLEPLATFEDQSFTGLDYFATNFDTQQLNVIYDAYAADAASGILVTFTDASGNISTGTLDLPTAVPEPSAFAALAGVLALGCAAARRRRKTA